MRRYLIPLCAFVLGTGLIAVAYFGIFTGLQGWDYARGQFASNRAYIVPIWLTFGIQSAIYAVLRFRLFVPFEYTGRGGALLGASGGTSVTTMVACCLHHIADVLPILGVSAAAMFLTRYQRPFMRLSLGINLAGILFMLVILYREWQSYQLLDDFDPVMDIE